MDNALYTKQYVEHVEDELGIQKAANRDLLRQLDEVKQERQSTVAGLVNEIWKLRNEDQESQAYKDLKLKFEYQVRRADSAETRIFELREVNDMAEAELRKTQEELQLIRHILVEVANGRFQKVPNPIIPENVNQTDLSPQPTSGTVTPVWPSGQTPSFNHGTTTWPVQKAKC